MSSFKVGPRSILISFDQKILEKDEYLRNAIVTFFMERPKVYLFSPNFKITCSFKEELNPDTIVKFATLISKQIIPSDLI